MPDHQRDDLIIAQFTLTKFEFAINRFARAQKLARLEVHLFEQLAKFLFAQRFDVVVNLFEVDATLTEQLVQLATLGSSRFFVNSDHKDGLCTWGFVLCSLANLTALMTPRTYSKNSSTKYKATKIFFYGNIPLTRVASATRSIARM